MNPQSKLRIGDWCVDPVAGQMSRNGEAVRLEARSMRLLLDLAQHAGEDVSIDDLLTRVWAGVTVTQDSVYQAVAGLRRLLGDDPKQPSYIATAPRLGYRMIAPVAPWTEAAEPGKPSPHRLIAAGIFVIVTLLCGVAVYEQASHAYNAHVAAAVAEPVAVGVLPFLDFTDAMDQEPLADSVTEGLSDKLGANPYLRSPSFRSSFQLKGKHTTIAEAAKILRVAYVIDGAVRRNGSEVKITARLTRADTGFVVWARAYNRPLTEIGDIQADIVAHVAKVVSNPPQHAANASVLRSAG